MCSIRSWTNPPTSSAVTSSSPTPCRATSVTHVRLPSAPRPISNRPASPTPPSSVPSPSSSSSTTCVGAPTSPAPSIKLTPYLRRGNPQTLSHDGNIGHRPGVKGGYFPVPPVDALHDIRAAMCLALEEMGVPVEVHHHEVATAGQCEIGTRFNTLVRKADETFILKYVVHNVAHSY